MSPSSALGSGTPSCLAFLVLACTPRRDDVALHATRMHFCLTCVLLLSKQLTYAFQARPADAVHRRALSRGGHQEGRGPVLASLHT